MQTNSRIFDDIARLASGALGTAQGMKSEWENLAHQRIERLVASMDLVSREEFDAVKAMVVSLSETVEAQSATIAELEKKLAAPKKKTATRKPKETAAPKD
ncbi:MAG: accessory factor UbiK family protein [Sneathiella sp.]